MVGLTLEAITLEKGQFVNSVVTDSYDDNSIACVESATKKLMIAGEHPVMLLGKVQSGKTRTFLGIISYAFDNGYDISVILTKGTRALAQQTLRRLQKTFNEMLDEDEIRIYDIMRVPDNLPRRDRRRKILLVVKKEDDNLARLSNFLFQTYPEFGEKKILIIDDEADLASVGFRRNGAHGVTMARLAEMIDDIRTSLTGSSFLQVTATPYSLFLQPEAILDENADFVFQPMRPAFTEIVPIHDKYVGGDTYFVRSEDPDSVESHMHCEVQDRELDAIRRQDGRRLRLEDVLTSDNCAALRRAIQDFIVGASVRRLQQREKGDRRTRYSMIVHTEQRRASHRWQMEVTSQLVDEFIRLAEEEPELWSAIVRTSFNRLEPALSKGELDIPSMEAIQEEARDIVEGVRIQVVNSDNDVFAMLDEDGQLRLESVLTVFIGGQILDRGITIDGLIGFYYGRNPRRFQQDTVLQHSRMYGARPIDDLPVTRFYTSDRLRSVMQTIHEFDHALRVALEKEDDRGVAFIMEDRGRIRPCAPNKVMLSKLTSLTPGKRLLPIGFQTKAPSTIRRSIERLDGLIDGLVGEAAPVRVNVADAEGAARQVLSLLNLGHEDCVFDERAFLSAIRYLSKQADGQDSVLAFARSGRHARRQFEISGRFNNVPFSGADAELSNQTARQLPCLMFLRQDGSEEQGWRGAPFWWPILQAPEDMNPVVFSAEVMSDE